MLKRLSIRIIAAINSSLWLLDVSLKWWTLWSNDCEMLSLNIKCVISKGDNVALRCIEVIWYLSSMLSVWFEFVCLICTRMTKLSLIWMKFFVFVLQFSLWIYSVEFQVHSEKWIIHYDESDEEMVNWNKCAMKFSTWNLKHHENNKFHVIALQLRVSSSFPALHSVSIQLSTLLWLLPRCNSFVLNYSTNDDFSFFTSIHTSHSSSLSHFHNFHELVPAPNRP